MVVIRLARGGAKKKPFYHINVTDKRNARDGRYIQRVGHFNPFAKDQETGLFMDRESIANWVKKGAQLSNRVQNLLKKWDKSQTVEK